MELQKIYTVEEFGEEVFNSMIKSIEATINIVGSVEHTQTEDQLRSHQLQTKMQLLKLIVATLKGDTTPDKIIHISNGKMFNVEAMKEVNWDELSNLIIETKR